MPGMRNGTSSGRWGVTRRQAAAAVSVGVVLVDIRPERRRERDGVIEGALFIPRTHPTRAATPRHRAEMSV